MKTVFLRALEADDKAATLRAAIREPAAARGKQFFEVATGSFAAIPRSPFAYWVSERLRRLFTKLPHFEADGRTARGGMKTQADERFLRATWECRADSRHARAWVPLCKGGIFSPLYADIHLMADWWKDGLRPRHPGQPSAQKTRVRASGGPTARWSHAGRHAYGGYNCRHPRWLRSKLKERLIWQITILMHHAWKRRKPISRSGALNKLCLDCNVVSTNSTIPPSIELRVRRQPGWGRGGGRVGRIRRARLPAAQSEAQHHGKSRRLHG